MENPITDVWNGIKGIIKTGIGIITFTRLPLIKSILLGSLPFPCLRYSMIDNQ